MTTPAVDVLVAGSVEPAERTEILSIEQAAIGSDGVSPLNDQVRLDLDDPTGGGARHLLARVPGRAEAVGYAHLVQVGSGEVASAHLAVHPSCRRQGIGTALMNALTAAANPGRLRVWAHGDEAAARFLSGRLGFRRVRDMWQMQMALETPLPEPTYPDGVVVRPFRPGRDDEGWAAVNAAAFREHPEQGDVSLPDLRQRMEQPWFDPAGFFLAEREGELLGFHWTKVHEADETHPERIGEVYVVGVRPDAQGLGLGKALTLTGLRHLQAGGLPAVMLYVEAENKAAIAVYERLGFRCISIDVMYEGP
ncbi:MAG: mycothiol synthase [Nocardioidaceae bacterium]|nr:mycothiol synthase [Nocardioidaceae bacterium]